MHAYEHARMHTHTYIQTHAHTGVNGIWKAFAFIFILHIHVIALKVFSCSMTNVSIQVFSFTINPMSFQISTDLGPWWWTFCIILDLEIDNNYNCCYTLSTPLNFALCFWAQTSIARSSPVQHCRSIAVNVECVQCHVSAMATLPWVFCLFPFHWSNLVFCFLSSPISFVKSFMLIHRSNCFCYEKGGIPKFPMAVLQLLFERHGDLDCLMKFPKEKKCREIQKDFGDGKASQQVSKQPRAMMMEWLTVWRSVLGLPQW